jgi:hypothetical protein
MSDAIDYYTGKDPQQSTLDRYNKDFTQTQITGPSSAISSGTEHSTGTSNQVTSGTQITSSSQINTTPDILNALQKYIASMVDRPNITQAELDKQAPLATMQYQYPGGWYWATPDGRALPDKNAADQFNAKQQVKRQELIQSAGITQGGTPAQQAIATARSQEIERDRATQGKYTKEAAFADAQGLSAYFQRVLSEQALPGLTRAAEGAGTSQGSMRALLQQRAVETVAEQASKLGLDAATQYGQINNQLANTLENLTKQDPNSVENQLINAIAISKGMTTSGSQVQNSSQVQTGTSTGDKVSQGVVNKSPDTQTTVKKFSSDIPAPSSPSAYSGGFQSLSSLSGTGNFYDTTPVIPQLNAGTSNAQDPNSDYSYYGGIGQFA